MPDLNKVFSKIKEAKKERKKLTNMYRESLLSSKSYKETVEQLNELMAKKHRIEAQVKQDFTQEMNNLEKLKAEIKDSNMVLSDMAITSFMKGETVAITDENDVKYEPSFSVKFKKTI